MSSIEGQPPEGILVTEDGHLADLCGRWRTAAAIALDTEFIRTRTFFPKLGLVQVGDPAGCYLLDVLALSDVAPLVELLLDPDTVKVLHSCSEDLEVLQHYFGVFPRPLFDTQIAATLTGCGYSLGYQKLVKIMFDLDLPKDHTRSNWLKRPLSEEQLEYASLDVAYLLPLHEILAERLESAGRSAWAEEEFERLETVARARLDPSWGWERLKKGRLTPRQRTVLHGLSNWREQAARDRDLPRSFVLSDDVLIALAKTRPKNHEQLKRVDGLRPRERRRSGDELLEAIEEANRLPPESDDRGSRYEDAGRSKGTVDALKKAVVQTAERHAVPAEYLAQRRLLKELIGNYRSGDPDPLPLELRGWRREVVGERLLELMRELG